MSGAASEVSWEPNGRQHEGGEPRCPNSVHFQGEVLAKSTYSFYDPYKGGISGFKRFWQRTHKLNHSNTARGRKPMSLRELTLAPPLLIALYQPHEELKAVTV